MMAVSKKMLDQEPSEIEMLLPFHAAGTLNARDTRRVDEALASDPDLARQYAVIREEYAETIHLNESLGAPSARAMQKLFAAIDGEPVRKPSLSTNHLGAGLGILHQAFAADAGLVGEPRRRAAAVAGRRDRRGADEEPDRFVPDRFAEPERAVRARSPAISAPRRRRARWCGLRRKRASPTSPRCSTIIRPRSSMAPRAACSGCSSATARMSKDEVAGLMSRLQGEKIVNLAVATP